MQFEEFKQKVEEWARVRGIYEQSTEAHQQAKALEEIGEYLTAENDDERIDAIGDIAVCIVNAYNLRSNNALYGLHIMLDQSILVGMSARWSEICDVASAVVDGAYDLAFGILCILAANHGFKFEACLEKAWNEIKDRKGMMIEGKYVKWESMSDGQKAEFNRRDSGNTLIRS